MIKKFFLFWVSLGIIIFINIFTTPAWAQLPLLPKLNLESLKLDSNLTDTTISACVYLDGRCVFELSGQKSNLGQRIKYAEEQLSNIKDVYLKSNHARLNVFVRGNRDRQSLDVAVGETNIPVMTLKRNDVVSAADLETQAEQIAVRIERGLETAREERQSTFLTEQAKLAGVVLLLMVLINFILFRQIERLNQAKVTLSKDTKSLSSELEQRKTLNLKEVQYRLLQLTQLTVWVGGVLIILGLFPYTRLAQLWIVTILRIPLRLIVVFWICYVLICLSYAAIARINAVVTDQAFNNYVFNADTNRRLQLRANTFSRLFRGIVTCFWGGIAIFIALTIIGLNITPLLAGAGVLGLAFSFASQNLIKDTINGLLIILEDQYAVGDVVTIGEVGGLVENLNLRITQLRDGDGRLITIPNSFVDIVANHSNGWSRSDLKIPVAYQTNVDEAIELIERVATEMYQDGKCRDNILEPPLVLGIEDFAERGFIVRLWFKTEPLKQWDISREFRRRLKNAFEAAGIALPLPQQQIWLSNDDLIQKRNKD